MLCMDIDTPPSRLDVVSGGQSQMGVMRASVVALALGTYSGDHERRAVKAVADLVRVGLSKWASIEVEPF